MYKHQPSIVVEYLPGKGIVREWKALHDIVARSHRVHNLDEPTDEVRRFLEVDQPFSVKKESNELAAFSGSVLQRPLDQVSRRAS